MSLTSLIQAREVAARLDLIIPKYQNRVYSFPYVSPCAERNRRTVIGTAFDRLHEALKLASDHAPPPPCSRSPPPWSSWSRTGAKESGVGRMKRTRDQRSSVIGIEARPLRVLQQVTERPCYIATR